LEASFDCLYQSGDATTASHLGMPDLAITALNDFVQSPQMVRGLSPKTPVIADADSRYVFSSSISSCFLIHARNCRQHCHGGSNGVSLCLCRFAAMHIEDQGQMKRCGYLMGNPASNC
ncbi:hypothetical protein F5141DRAFT_1003940, partial [Pisolithus sp. B1]